MHIYSFQGNLIRNRAVGPVEMADPTETHPFTFGCYRGDAVPGVDESAPDAASEESTDDVADPTPVTDGGVVATDSCPACEHALANVQGVPACPQCAWNGH